MKKKLEFLFTIYIRGFAVKNSGCCSRGSWFKSHHLHGSLQLSVILVSRNPTLLCQSVLSPQAPGIHVVHRYTCRKNVHTHLKIKYKFKSHYMCVCVCLSLLIFLFLLSLLLFSSFQICLFTTGSLGGGGWSWNPPVALIQQTVSPHQFSFNVLDNLDLSSKTLPFSPEIKVVADKLRNF